MISGVKREIAAQRGFGFGDTVEAAVKVAQMEMNWRPVRCVGQAVGQKIRCRLQLAVFRKSQRHVIAPVGQNIPGSAAKMKTHDQAYKTGLAVRPAPQFFLAFRTKIRIFAAMQQ